MPKQNCFSMRPGTLLGYKDRSWRVISNDTLNQQLTIQTVNEPKEQKRFRYTAGQELDIRWKPDTRL